MHETNIHVSLHKLHRPSTEHLLGPCTGSEAVICHGGTFFFFFCPLLQPRFTPDRSTTRPRGVEKKKKILAEEISTGPELHIAPCLQSGGDSPHTLLLLLLLFLLLLLLLEEVVFTQPSPLNVYKPVSPSRPCMLFVLEPVKMF